MKTLREEYSNQSLYISDAYMFFNFLIDYKFSFVPFVDDNLIKIRSDVPRNVKEFYFRGRDFYNNSMEKNIEIIKKEFGIKED